MPCAAAAETDAEPIPGWGNVEDDTRYRDDRWSAMTGRVGGWLFNADYRHPVMPVWSGYGPSWTLSLSEHFWVAACLDGDAPTDVERAGHAHPAMGFRDL